MVYFLVMGKKTSKGSGAAEIMGPIIAIGLEFDSIIGSLLQEKLQIPLADFKILRAVYMLHPCTQFDVACFNHVSEAAVSKRLKFLLERGLIEKDVDQEDKRKAILSLTPKGKILMKEMQSIVIAETEMILSSFSSVNRKITAELLASIMQLVMSHSPRKEMLMKSKHPIFKCKGLAKGNNF